MAVATALSELHKKVYENGVKPLMAEAVLLDIIKFKADKKTGKTYNRAIASAFENGFTFGGEAGDDFALESAAAGEIKEAEVKSNTTVLLMRLSNDAARAASTNEAAYAKATDWKFRNGLDSFASMMTGKVLYGQSPDGIGRVSGTPSTVGSDKLITISNLTWAPGLWLGRKNLKLEVYNGVTKINTNADVVVKSVDLANKQVLVSGNATDLGNIADTHTLLPKGWFAKAFVGLEQIARGPTTLWNLTVADAPDILKGTHISSIGTFSIQFLIDAAQTAASRGGSGKFTAVVSLKLFGEMVGADTALRRLDGSYSKKKTSHGTETLEIISGGIVLDVVPVNQCMEGKFHLFPTAETYRVGSTDITEKTPDGKVEWHQLEAVEAMQMKLTASFAPFTDRPSAVILGSGITYGS